MSGSITISKLAKFVDDITQENKAMKEGFKEIMERIKQMSAVYDMSAMEDIREIAERYCDE